MDKLTIERLEKKPFHVLYDTLERLEPKTFRNHANQWLLNAITNSYDDDLDEAQKRQELIVLFLDLTVLVEALGQLIDFKKEPNPTNEIITKKCLDVIHRFFVTQSIKNSRRILWVWLTAAMTKPKSIYSDHAERGNLLWYYQNSLYLLEAANRLMKLGMKEKYSPNILFTK